MSSAEYLFQETVHKEARPIRIPVAELVMAVWQNRHKLLIVTGLGVLLAIVIALLMPNEYQSTAQLMPPDQQSFARPSAVNSLAGASLVLPAAAGNLLSARTPGATAIGILNSSTVQDYIINRFDLRKEYHYKFYVDTQKELAKRTILVEDKKSGIITISVVDPDRYRARDMAGAYIEELDRIVNSLSTSSARRERIFLEGRLKSIKADMDSSSQALSQFSSRNGTFDIQKQGESTVEKAGKLQGELIVAQSELSGLRAKYTDENVQVREAKGRVDELQRQLRQMTGTGGSAGVSSLDSEETLPSVRELPIFAFTYYNLYRKVTMEEELYETLTKQYELAGVQEAEDIPPIKVLDPPNLPERKSSPHRAIIVFVGMLLSTLAGIAWIVSRELWRIMDDAHPAKELAGALLQALQREQRGVSAISPHQASD